MRLKSVLIIGYVWPEPTSSAAGSRMMQLIHYFKRLGGSITFASPSSIGEHPIDLNAIGLETAHIQLNCSSFDDFIKELNPQIVLFDRYMMEEQFGWRVAEHCPKAIRILDTEDLHFLRAQRQQCFNQSKEVQAEMLFESTLAKREIASIYRSDLALIISEYEVQLLEEVFKLPKYLLCYLPLTVEKSVKGFLKWNQRKDFVFIGNFLHAPNWDAVRYLRSQIWPQIHKKLPQAQLHIYGAYCTDKVFQLQQLDQGFVVHGWVENAQQLIQTARVTLAPLRFGAGLKGKLLEAMAVGTPNVTSTIGAEGLQGDFCWGGKIADDVKDFVESAISLYGDEKLWEKAQSDGYELLKERFNNEFHFQKFSLELGHCIEGVENHRTENFIGAMLMQQTTNASKYMAKWIEAKNKH